MKYAVNKATGQRLVWDPELDEWRPERPGEAAARDTGPVQAALVETQRVLRKGLENTGTLGVFGITPEQQAEDAPLLADLQAARPVASAVGGMLPSLATGPLGVTGAAGRALAGQALEQGLIGAGTGALFAEDGMGSGALEGAAWGAGGVFGGRMAGRIVTGIKGAASEIKAARAAKGAAAGAGGKGAAGGALDDALMAATEDGGAAPLGRATMGAGMPTGAPAGGAIGEAGATAPIGHARLVSEADRLGLQLTPAQRLWSGPARQVEAGLKSSPWSSGVFESVQKNNQRRINTLAARALGAAGDELNPDVLDKAADRIGKVFTKTAKQAGRVNLDTPVLKASIDQLKTDFGKGSFKQKKVLQALEGLDELKDADGLIDGRRLMQERANMTKAYRESMKAGQVMRAEGYGQVIEHIDLAMEGALEKSAKGQLAAGHASEQMAAYKEARNQWRLLRNIERGGVTEAGDVMPGALRQNLRQDFGTTWSRATDRARLGDRFGDLFSALRVQSQFRDIVGDSGTATRMAAQGLTSRDGIVKALIGGTLGKAYMHNPALSAAVIGARGVPTPEAGQVGGLLGRLAGGL
jgi:hypothetical protein